MKIIRNQSANSIRNRFIETFINKKCEAYVNDISKPFQCSDGICYTSYLWDALKNPSLVSEENIKENLKHFKKFYIMWDIHSKDYIFIPNYWKYPKECILLLTAVEFRKMQNDLPEDIYVFDDSFNWTYVYTHEEMNGKRYCLMQNS